MAKNYLYLSDLLANDLFTETELWGDFCSRCPNLETCSYGMDDEECTRRGSYLKIVKALEEFNAKLADAVNE